MWRRLAVCVLVLSAGSGGFSAPSRAEAKTPGFPSALEEFRKNDGNCAGMEAEVPDPNQGPDGTLPREYAAFIREEACRLTRFNKAFLSDPAKFCPGVLPGRFNACFGKILRAFVAKPGLDESGLIMMQATAITYLMRRKKDFPSPTDAALAVIDSGWKILGVLGQRTTAEKFARKHPDGKPQTPSDAEFASKFALEILKTNEESLDKLDKSAWELDARTRARLTPKIDESHQALADFAGRWGYKLAPSGR